MHKVNFYKAYSRLGLINAPLGSSEANIGVEDAPDAILTEDFLHKFDVGSVNSFTFSKPEEIDKAKYFKIMLDESLKFADLIEIQQKKSPGTAVVIGGDHSVSFGSIIADMNLYGPENVGVIHFDSHADSCDIASSPSGNFHGMFLRALVDKNFDNKDIRSIKQHLPAKNLFLIGNLDFDEDDPEKAYLDREGIQYHEQKDIDKDRKAFERKLKDFIASFEHIHVSFDIDVFDRSIAPATGTPPREGFKLKIILNLLLTTVNSDSNTYDLVEVNAKKVGVKKTLNIATDILKAVLD